MYKSLQAGRAIAAIMVVFFHLGSAISSEKYFGIPVFSTPFSFGGAGVEFFFVLSGFIIYTAHRDDIFKPHKLTSYIKKRIIRIYPIYWITFLSVYCMAFASTSLRNTVPHDVFIIIKSLLLIPQDKDIVGGNGSPVLTVAWTLNYEMFFYSFFAFLILNRWLSIAIGLIALYIYINYAEAQFLAFPLSYFSKDLILLFAMGMAISAVSSSKKVIINRPLFYAKTGAALFIILALDTITGANIFKDWKTILYGLASSLIVFGLVKSEDNGKVIGKQKWIQLLGDSSYCLYLIHFPLISMLCKIFLLIQLNKLNMVGAVISFITIVAICLISSVAFHLWIEKPVTEYFRSRFIKPAFAT